MDAHTWALIFVGLLNVVNGLISAWQKMRIDKKREKEEARRIAAEKKREEDDARRAAELLHAQQVAADTLAAYNKLIGERLESKIDKVHEEVKQNTSITEQAVEVNAKALQEANNFNVKFQVLAEADAERVLAGRYVELTTTGKDEAAKSDMLRDMHRLDKDTNERVRRVEEQVQSVGQKEQS